MARGRLLASSLSTSQKFARLHDEAGPLAEFCQVLFTLLVAHADECGRLPGDPWTVKHRVVPTWPRGLPDVQMALDALARVGLIQCYAVGGEHLIAIAKFQEHQALRHPPQSALPPPPGTPLDPAPPDPSCPGMDHHSYIPGQHTSKRREEKGSKEKRRPRAFARGAPFGRYLDACPHDPVCHTPQVCGQRRQVAAAVAAGTITAAEAARLEQLWLTERQMLRATSRPPRKAEAV